jgi:hypothetical protein
MATQSTIKADETVSVEDFIAMSTSDELTYYNYSILEYLNGYDMFVTSILYDYDDELNELVSYVKFTDLEKSKYRYKPNVLAYDVYGSTELKFIIMQLNGIIDPKEFDFDIVKLITPSNLKTILSRITSVNENFLSLVNSKLKDDFKNSKNGNTIWNE